MHLHSILRHILHILLQPIIKWSVVGMIGGLLMGRLMRSRTRISILLDLVAGFIGAHVARRLAAHFLGLYSENTYLYIAVVGLSGGALLTLMMRLAIGQPGSKSVK